MKTTVALLLALTALPLAADDAKPAVPAARPPATVPKTVVRNVDANEFDRLRSGANVVVLDVRTPAEFADGHLPGAVLVDYKAPDFAAKAGQLDKTKTYLVHCAAGVRSAKACAKMEGLGFTNLINLEGGFTAWKEAGKPVEK